MTAGTVAVQYLCQLPWITWRDMDNRQIRLKKIDLPTLEASKGLMTFLGSIFSFHSADQLFQNFPRVVRPLLPIFTALFSAVDIVEGYESIQGVCLIDRKNFCEKNVHARQSDDWIITKNQGKCLLAQMIRIACNSWKIQFSENFTSEVFSKV